MTRIVDLAQHNALFVSVSELADYWGVSERTIYRDIEKGAVGIVRVGSTGIIRIPIDEARAYGKPDDDSARQP